MTPPLPSAFLERPLAHRGLHDGTAACPENSLAAVAAAVDAGYGIEIDIQPSADGEAMVFHDATLRRLTGRRGRTDETPAEELERLHLLGGPDTVPRLETVLARIGGRVPLLIEIKDQDGALGPNVGTLERAAARALSGYRGPVAVMSFNPHAVAAMRELAPEVPRGLTTCRFAPSDYPGAPAEALRRLAAIADFDTVGASFISHDARDLDNPAVAALKARDVPVLCWTIRSAAAAATARTVADNITFEGFRPATPAP